MSENLFSLEGEEAPFEHRDYLLASKTTDPSQVYFPLSYFYVGKPEGTPRPMYTVDVRDEHELAIAQSLQPVEVDARYTMLGEPVKL